MQQSAKTEETNKVNGLPTFSTENQATEPQRELKIIQLQMRFCQKRTKMRAQIHTKRFEELTD